jgi:ABC-type transporter Mla MlaB component
MESKSAKDTTRLYFEGELTVMRATEIKDNLIDALLKSQHVEIEFGEVTKVDLSCLQLMCSAHRTAVEKGKSLALINPDVPQFSGIKEIVGFAVHKECRFNRKNDCLWLEE